MATVDLLAPIAQARSTTRPRFYRPELDAVRFLAFLAVFASHTIPRQPGPHSHAAHFTLATVIGSVSSAGSYGVCLFFTLSAYLICELLLREREQTANLHISAFYKRRILRIWPLYFLGLTIGCVFAIANAQLSQLPRFGAYALLMGNWYEVLFGFQENPLNVLWSISVEEQFYLFSPWLLQRLTRRSLAIFCGALIVTANLVLYTQGVRHPDGWDLIWRNSFVQFQMFAIGMLLSLYLRHRVPRLRIVIRLMLLCTGPGCWFCAVYFLHLGETVTSPLKLLFAYALCTAGCLSVLVGALGFPAKWIPASMVWLGKISFGLYVYHAIALHLLGHIPKAHSPALLVLERFVAPFVLTVAMAAVSYRFFETPFLRKKRHLEVVASRPV